MAPIGIRRSAAPGAATRRASSPRRPGAWRDEPPALDLIPGTDAGLRLRPELRRQLPQRRRRSPRRDRPRPVHRPGALRAAALRGGRDAGGDPRRRRSPRLVPAGRARHQVGHGGRRHRQRHPRQEPSPRRNVRGPCDPLRAAPLLGAAPASARRELEPRALRGHHRRPGTHRPHPLGRDPAPAGGRRRDRAGAHPVRGLDEFLDACRRGRRPRVHRRLGGLPGRGRRLGRGVYLRGDHVPFPGSAPSPRRGAGLRVPFDAPSRLLNRATLAAFNALHYRAAARESGVGPPCRTSPSSSRSTPSATGTGSTAGRDSSSTSAWCPTTPAAAPSGRSSSGQRVRRSRRRSGCSSGSARLASPGLLSFPRPGLTLAIDFAFRGPATLELLDELDATSARRGGAVYPAKDARMSPESFRAFFPAWKTFAAQVDPRFSSSFWRRVAWRSLIRRHSGS